MLSSANEVPVGPPPTLGSAEYAAAYNEVKEIGSLSSLTRTVDQTNSALFWDVSNGGTWIRAGLVVAEDEGLDTLGFAGVFANLAVGIADATWTSLFAAPGHPSYVSGHAGISGVASTILQPYFGDTEAFSFSIGSDNRSFTSLSQAAQDAADSRLWGGIHFRFDNEVGLASGQQVGTNVLRRGIFASVPEPSSWAMMIFGFALAGWKLRSCARRQEPVLAP